MPIIFNTHNTINGVFILKIIVRNLDMFHNIWAKFQDFKKGLALTLFRSLVFQ